MTDQVFISYRKTDEPGFAGRIFDRLEGALTDTKIFMDARLIAGVLPDRCVRIIAVPEQFPTALGGGSGKFVFVADHEELRGRFLKDILRDFHWGEATVSETMQYLALKFTLDRSRLSGFCPIPATPNAVGHATKNFESLPLAETDPDVAAGARFEMLARKAALGEPNEISASFQEWHEVIDSPGLLLQGLTADGRGRSEFGARHLLVRNIDLTDLDFEVQRLGLPSDLIALT